MPRSKPLIPPKPGEACALCGHRATDPDRSAAAKRAWDTIRANREAGYKTTAERKAAEVKASSDGKVTPIKATRSRKRAG